MYDLYIEVSASMCFSEGVCCVLCVFDTPTTLEFPIKEFPIDIRYRYTYPHDSMGLVYLPT